MIGPDDVVFSLDDHVLMVWHDVEGVEMGDDFSVDVVLRRGNQDRGGLID